MENNPEDQYLNINYIPGHSHQLLLCLL